METDIHGESNGSTDEIKENGFILYPVSVNDSGEGLPYAPIDWPNPGDKWSWRVGNRTVGSGYFHDRYLYLPRRLWGGGCKRRRFASKFSVEQYIRSAFPGVDVNAFFASFSWKIPSKKLYEAKGNEEGPTITTGPPAGDKTELSGSDSQFRSVVCNAGNRMCCSLAEARSLPSEAMVCDVCCSEPGFCRDCCCILCCKTIDLAYGGYSFIRCEATVVQGFICGHVAHIDCALRSHMAGTVGGSIGLDAEYYCRRCDARRGLISHVTKLLQTCESIDSRDDIQKILNIGVGILRGSQKSSAKRLLDHIELVMAKLKSGTCSKDDWKMEDISAILAGDSQNGNDAVTFTNNKKPLDHIGSPQIFSGNFDYRIESLKLEDEIDRILKKLRKSQEMEYKIAEERLHFQKDHLLNLYQKLDKERFELSKHISSIESEALLDAVLDRMDQIKREIIKLRDMEKVSQGFGKASEDILREHFGLETEH